MAGSRSFPLRNTGAFRGARTLALLFLFLCSLPAFSQLPGTKPREFAPVIPDFNALSADWWTGWPQADLEQREQWLGELETAWDTWRATLPESEELQLQEQLVGRRLQAIRNTWQRRAELQKLAVLPEVEFPADPDVLQWAQTDAALARGNQRRYSLELELRQVEETLAQSLAQLRQQIVVLRDLGRDRVRRERVTIALFAAQLNHLQILEQRALYSEQLATWEEELQHAEDELQRMLRELQYSEEAAAELKASIDELREKEEQATGERARILGALPESEGSAEDMQRELRIMALEVESVENQLRVRKAELLYIMNEMLVPDAERQPLALSGDLVTTSRKLAGDISRELNLRRQQVVAWAGEDSEAMRRWWNSFQEVDSGLVRINELGEDVLRYDAALLELYRQHQGWLAVARERGGLWLELVRDRWSRLADYKLFAIAENPVSLRDLARAVIAVVVALLISALIRRFLNRLVAKQRASESSMYNLGRLLHYLIIAIAILVALAMLGLDTSKLALVAGALSVGIGFGLQSIFSNFISGVILLFEQPLRVGDLVQLESGVFGRIREINVRSTRITTRDNVDIMVPNSEFIVGRVTNLTLYDPVRRIHVPFTVAYGSDPDLVREAALAAAERVSITHSDWQRKTEVWLTGFGDSALEFELVVWVNSNMISPLGDTLALYNLELLHELGERNLEKPFPQRELHLRTWPQEGSGENPPPEPRSP